MMLEPVETQAKEALVAAMGAIDQTLLTCGDDGKSQIDHPDERETGNE